MTCPTCSAPFRKLYTFGIGPYCGGGCAEVRTFRCPHAVAVRFDPVGVLEPAVSACSSYGEAAGKARLHVMLMRDKGLA